MRRILSLAAAAAVLPMPALAGETASAERDLAQAAEEMRDPARQEQVGRLAEAAMGAMLEMPVGKLLQAAATMAGEEADAINPDVTLAEVAGPAAEDTPRQFALAMPRVMEAMGVLTAALGSMLPGLAKVGEDIVRTMPDDPIE